MVYEWYADVFFLNNFLMDAAALLMAAVCLNRRVFPGRIFLVAAGASAASMGLLLFLPSWLWYVLLVHIVLNPMMTVLAFRLTGWKDFLTQLIAVYLLLLVAGGAQESLRLQLGLRSFGVILLSGILTMALFAVWQIRRRVTGRICVADLWFGEQKISVKAYCDSGNLLRHPETGKPVSILDRQVLPPVWQEKLGMPDKIFCRTVSSEHSLMEVITLDKMDVYLGGAVREIQTPLFGLHSGKLAGREEVQLLLNGAICE